MTEENRTQPKTWGLVMLLLGVLLALGAFIVAVDGSYFGSEQAFGAASIAMMALMVVGIVIAFLGFQRVMRTDLPPMAPPRHYNEYQVVCEKCEAEIPPGATECPKCGNKIDWSPPEQ